MEKSIRESCNVIPDVKVVEEEPPPEKVMKLTLAIKESKNTLETIKFEYEVKI